MNNTTTEEQPGEGSRSVAAGTAGADFKKSWRWRVGLTMILVGHLVLLAAMLVPLLGMSVTFAGFLFMSGELMSLVSIVFLGKEGFKEIKGKFVGIVRAGFVAPVGRMRHYIGIVLVCFNAVPAYVVGVLAWQISMTATAEAPTPVIWGLDWRRQLDLTIYLIVAGEAAFVLGIYVLGADWWGRFRQLFVWQPAGPPTPVSP